MHKRGISEVVSYVLLIVISMALATLVFVFLKAYVPKQDLECKDGISLIIKEITCVNTAGQNALSLSLENRGRFKVDKAYLRIGKDGRQFKSDISPSNPVTLLNEDGDPGLNPQEIANLPAFDLPTDFDAVGTYIIEIQPAYSSEKSRGSLVLCPPITEQIVCS